MGAVLAGLAKAVPAVGKGLSKAAPFLSGASSFGNPIANMALQAGRGALGGLAGRQTQPVGAAPQGDDEGNQIPSAIPLTLEQRLKMLGIQPFDPNAESPLPPKKFPSMILRQ